LHETLELVAALLGLREGVEEIDGESLYNDDKASTIARRRR
jgi:hypothetical protein